LILLLLLVLLLLQAATFHFLFNAPLDFTSTLPW
jgi:hypothetical protein